ncbi:hypothetical protein VB776_16370 [Arcicella sp. DC2W]|uniref:Uncharacterized protein n=1 Tax=Arcicella gelida TaxID=2984195 RepID=A0ABU5S7R6_9BACT|nr:hypothetical protein [Arcicella sp. DC2W]MEA5404509.1 hypothetical protein [Arcicella sp. DC2W]
MTGGTIIYSKLTSPNPADKTPHVDAKKVEGGHQIVDTIEERDLIDAEIRREEMTCYVKDTGIIYQLEGGILNENWIPAFIRVEMPNNYALISSSTHKRFIIVTADEINNSGGTGLYLHNGIEPKEILLL